jgi:hypothetical protein
MMARFRAAQQLRSHPLPSAKLMHPLFSCELPLASIFLAC